MINKILMNKDNTFLLNFISDSYIQDWVAYIAGTQDINTS
jgi:hypothetical protein